MIKKKSFELFNLNPWESEYGYSAAVKIGNVIHISGCTGYRNGTVPDSFTEQMKNAYANIEDVLKAYGLSFEDIAVEKIYAVDMNALRSKEIISLRKTFYENAYPASTWIGVASLLGEKDLIEIEVSAVISE